VVTLKLSHTPAAPTEKGSPNMGEPGAATDQR
jgi:hypothetical protein